MNVGTYKIIAAAMMTGFFVAQAEPVVAQPRQEVIVDPDSELTLDDEVPADLARNGVIRSGRIRLPADLFVEPPSDLPPDPVNIPIGEGRAVSLVEMTRRTGSEGRIYVIGVDQLTPHSRFVMLIRDNALDSGEIRLHNEVINLTGPVPDNGHLVFRLLTVDPTQFPAERTPVERSAPGLEPDGSSGDATPSSESGADEPAMAGGAAGPQGAGEDAASENAAVAPIEVKLLVVYTPAAAAAAQAYYVGKTIEDKIVEAVDKANWGLEDQANVTLNLVYKKQVVYTETGDIAKDLKRLECPCDHKFKKKVGDNHLNEVFPLWKLYEADIVSLWIDSTEDSGIANIMNVATTDFAPFAVNVVSWQAATQRLTFDHEIGHNFSARHNWAMDPTNFEPYTYNHGYVNTATTLVTIMSYESTCLVLGFWCLRLPIWSDPTWLPAGAWGTAVPGPLAADNAQAIVASSPFFSNLDLKHNLVGCCVNYGGFFNRKYAPGPCP